EYEAGRRPWQERPRTSSAEPGTLPAELHLGAWARASWPLSRPLLVVVHDLDLRRAFRRPHEAYPELVVDPSRVLSFAIARQSLETVARRRPQVGEIASGVEVAQLPARHLDQIDRKAFRTLAVEDGLGGLVAEASDHEARCIIG